MQFRIFVIVGLSLITGSGCPAPGEALDPVEVQSGIDAVMFAGGPATGYVGGGVVSFTSGVVNADLSAGGAVTVDGTVTTGLAITSASGTGWTCTVGTGGGSFSCDHAGPLAGGSSMPAIAVDTDPVGPVGTATFCATVTVSGDNDAANDEDCHALNLSLPTAAYDLRVEKAPSTDTTLSPGAPGIYRIDIHNDGPDVVPDAITFTDTIPAGMTVDFVSTPISGEWSCTTSGQTVTCTRIPGMLLYEQNSVFIYVTLAADLKGEVENCVTVNGPQDSNAGNDTDCYVADLPVPAPFDLSVQKVDWAPYVAGATGASWQIVIKNLGPNVATGAIVIDDVLPPGVTVNGWGGTSLFLCSPGTGGGSLACTATTAIPVGAAQQLYLSVNVPAGTPAPLVNCAQLTAAGDTNPDNDRSCSNSQGNTDVSITKALVGDLVFGGTATYTLAIENVGPLPVPWSPVVSDGLPPGSVLTSVSASSLWNCNSSGSYLACGYTGSLPVALGSLGSITYTVSVAPEDFFTEGFAENCAKVEPIFPDATPADNTSCVRVDVPFEPIDIAVGVALKGGIRANGRTVVVVEATNGGGANVILPFLAMPLPPGASFLGARELDADFGCELDQGEVRCNPTVSIAPGATVSVEIDLLLDAEVVAGSALQVCAEASAEDGSLLASTCASATVAEAPSCVGHKISPELMLYDEEFALVPAPAGTIVEDFLRDPDDALLPAGTEVRSGSSFSQSSLVRVVSVGTSTQYSGGVPVEGTVSPSVQWTGDGVNSAYVESYLADDVLVGQDAIDVTSLSPVEGLLLAVDGAGTGFTMKVFDAARVHTESFDVPAGATRAGVANLCGSPIGSVLVVPSNAAAGGPGRFKVNRIEMK